MSGGVFDSDAIDKSIAEKMKQSEAPGFWDDHEAAEKVMAQVRRLKNRVEPWRDLLKDMDDLDAMYELASESGGQDEEDEVRQMYEAAKQKFEKLNILNLLSGEVDQNDAYLTVHAGAGGTEACDWAFMLSRMYLRWAERHGYKTEVLDEQRAELNLSQFKFQGTLYTATSREKVESIVLYVFLHLMQTPAVIQALLLFMFIRFLMTLSK